ncbi:hypothetical protein [Sulfurimonas sp.]|uniref:hypothetical protein n=1 Tax=Sulfurimonas sp. TaxID=2022749 RepID=UPI003D135B0E
MIEKRERKKGKSLFSLSTLLASFFGAAMIAGAFAYFNYKFSEYKFIDFKEWVFYEKNDLFTPKEDKYLVVFYSSKQKNAINEITNLQAEFPTLAIDYYNHVIPNTNRVTFLRTGTNTSLKFIQRFNIYKTPSIFFIKKQKDSLYKQDSMIHKLDNLRDISKTIQTL